jgi:hypothetical protein
MKRRSGAQTFFSARSTAGAYGHLEYDEGETSMKGELPMERQAVQVQLDNGDWQTATYQDGQFVDLYGLPLDHHKIRGWRPAGGAANGSGVAQDRRLRNERRAPI